MSQVSKIFRRFIPQLLHMIVLSVAKISYEKWFRFIWKFILVMIVIGFLLLLPTLFVEMPGF